MCTYTAIQSYVLGLLGYVAEFAALPGFLGWFFGSACLRVMFPRGGGK